jgi:hypothetical protein
LPDTDSGVAALAAAQAQLAAALVAAADPPAGFDRTRLSGATAALAGKRTAAIAKLLPALWRSLGDGAGSTCRAYVRGHLFPGDHEADALGFAAAACTSESPVIAIREVLLLRVRAGWPLRVARARRDVLVAVRVAGRTRCCRLPG